MMWRTFSLRQARKKDRSERSHDRPSGRKEGLSLSSINCIGPLIRARGEKALVRELEKSERTKKSSKGKSPKRAEKIREGLQKELDALVLPISVRKEHPEDRGEVQVVKKPVEKERVSRSELEKEDQVKSIKKKVNPWGIVIGETD